MGKPSTRKAKQRDERRSPWADPTGEGAALPTPTAMGSRWGPAKRSSAGTTPTPTFPPPHPPPPASGPPGSEESGFSPCWRPGSGSKEGMQGGRGSRGPFLGLEGATQEPQVTGTPAPGESQVWVVDGHEAWHGAFMDTDMALQPQTALTSQPHPLQRPGHFPGPLAGAVAGSLRPGRPGWHWLLPGPEGGSLVSWAGERVPGQAPAEPPAALGTLCLLQQCLRPEPAVPAGAAGGAGPGGQ